MVHVELAAVGRNPHRCHGNAKITNFEVYLGLRSREKHHVVVGWMGSSLNCGQGSVVREEGGGNAGAK